MHVWEELTYTHVYSENLEERYQYFQEYLDNMFVKQMP